MLRLGSGPLWNVIAKQENQFCVSNWWTNVLFVSNYVNSKEMVGKRNIYRYNKLVGGQLILFMF